MAQERNAPDEREGPVQPGGPRPTHGGREARSRLRRRRRHELEENGQIADGDLSTRPLVEQQEPGVRLAANPARLLELRQRDDFVAHRDAGIHGIGETRDIALGRELEEHPLLGQCLGGNRKGGLARPTDRDVLARSDQAFLDDPPALHDADAQDSHLRGRVGCMARLGCFRGCLDRHGLVPSLVSSIRTAVSSRCPEFWVRTPVSARANRSLCSISAVRKRPPASGSCPR